MLYEGFLASELYFRQFNVSVAAVSDGLKAWEVLKARAENIDLILTEVELPSISGYALLTLIMEHDICKKIPVIMMSSYDSVSIVYKCMLRGAADFLVKPVRKNELRNLWQHVWRKQVQSSGAGRVPLDESMAQQKIEATAENNATSNHSSQQKIEATAENNAASNHSSGYRACVQRNRECIEKGTDAQSSCTRPELETDEPDVEHLHSLLQPKTNKCLSDDVNIYVHKESQEEIRRTIAHDNEGGGLQTVASIDVSNETTRGQDKNSASEQVNVNGQSSMNSHVREAIDLIGAFSNCCKGTLPSPASNTSTNKFDMLPLLDLSLRGSHPSGSVNQENDETHRINHSDASAFSRYVNKSLPNSTSRSTCNQQKDLETNSEKQQSNHTPEYTSDAHGSRISSQKYASVTGIQPELPETPFSDPQLKETSQPFPVRGVRFENVINGSGAVMPEMHSAQSGLSPLPSPGAASNSQPFAYSNPFHQADHQPANSQSVRDLLDQRINCTMHQTDNKQGQEQETFEDTGHVSFANDQSRNSGFYNSYTSHHHSIGSGDIGKINSISVVNATSDAASEDGVHVHDSTSSRSVQREAALTKFRLKRKERCFEKKVRYESRRKLAEQC
ncbi:two-component response regulator-like APRR5 isoform X5 [Salvia splendens]|uniref:two-component response regulator-like APRR5 isoform X5 n=1 Tax=Salvia splendens TaxID=180675 RepID=UPI001C273D35|nr:two-component response regulator-like APRR5 isoform X5 [Salvia splendens]XP_042063910.1 two-component response regulator-like APRR5 isoform X5 [Salvia splendens]